MPACVSTSRRLPLTALLLPILPLSFGASRAIADEPAVIVADEPTSALDAENRAVVLTALRQAAASGASVLITTNDTQLAQEGDLTVVLTQH